MSPIKIAAIALIVAGALGLAYGAFTYTSAIHHTELGPLELTTREHETVRIPIWLGVAAVVGGGLMLFVPGRR